MWSRFRQALVSCIDLLLPPACLLCGRLLQAGDNDHAFCKGCQITMLPLSLAHCSLCAQPFPDSISRHLCGNCLKRPPLFTMVYAASLYQGGTKEAVQRLKYRNQLTLAKPLGQRLATFIIATENDFIPDCIVPVPLHADRLRQRGYNQAVELARPIAQQLKVPLDTTLLQRTRKTPQQQGLSATERRSNLRNAFALTASTPARRILLVDDVMTTGETVRECCRTLLKGGVTEVQVAVAGRA